MTFRNLKSPLGMTCEAVNTTKHFKSVFPHRSVNLLSREIKGTMLVSLEFIEGDHRGLVHWEELHGRDGT